MMLLDLRKEEAGLTAARNTRRDARTMKTEGKEAGVRYKAIADALVADVVAALPEARMGLLGTRNGLRELAPTLAGLSDEVIAVSALQAILHSIGEDELSGDTARTIGQYLEYECFGAGLTVHNERFAKMVAESAAKIEGDLDKRRTYAMKRAAKGLQASKNGKHPRVDGYAPADWGPEMRSTVGMWLLVVVMNARPDTFVFDGTGHGHRVVLTEQAQAVGEAAVSALAHRNHVFLPMLVPPTPWVSLTGGGPVDGRIHTTKLLRLKTSHEATAQMVKDACANGQAQKALDGINALQGQGWRINEWVLGVFRQCFADDRRIKGLPRAKLARLEVESMFPGVSTRDGLTEEQQRHFDSEQRAVKRHNRTRNNDRLSIERDMSVADMFTGKTFYVPYNMDWRGRAYGMTSFNFLREDRVRSLFLFSDSKPLGDDGFKWLCHHAAGCYAEDDGTGRGKKTDKIPTVERVAWVWKNIEKIIASAEYPLTEPFWTTAGDPWLFLATCYEIASALRHPSGVSEYTCALPVAFDGSCSGLQHYCALTRAPEGRFVNLTSSQYPMDVYQEVADIITPKVKAIAARGGWSEAEAWRPVVAQLWLDYCKGAITRKVTKRGVMTWAYSSEAPGMGNQIQEDLMDELASEVLAGERAEHPFGDYAKGGFRGAASMAAAFMGDLLYESIQDLVPHAGQAMKYLQHIAKATAADGKPATWVTPVGIPWVNRYNVVEEVRVQLWLKLNGPLKPAVRVRERVATGEDEVAVRPAKSKNAIAPNFIHALDAAHLLRVAARCGREGLAIATVHDSFGCHPGSATYFNRLVREEFIGMYAEHDPLQEIREQCAEIITDPAELPDRFDSYGTLDLSGLLQSEFAFS